MKYYIASTNVYDPNIWYFDDLLETNSNWNFVIPEFYRSDPTEKPITHVRYGKGETDFTNAGYAAVPCLSQKAKDIILTLNSSILAQVDFLPLEICNYKPKQAYYALVAKLLKDCVDEHRSEWSEVSFLDGETPTSRGFLRKYGTFFTLRVDHDRTDNLDMFRLEGGHDLIVSQRFKDLWQSAGLTGMCFSQGVNHLNL